jgi:hypothetical protein
MTALTTAIEREQYDLVALRLLLGVAAAIEQAAPSAREELVALLTLERS